jgi:hypothetical protein
VCINGQDISFEFVTEIVGSSSAAETSTIESSSYPGELWGISDSEGCDADF